MITASSPPRAVAIDCLKPPLRPGETGLLQGVNGAGKSTLLRRIAGLEGDDSAPAPGTLLLQQNPDTQFLCTTVAEEILLPMHRARVSEREAEHRGRDALASVDVPGSWWSRPVNELSMGFRQRVLVAMALASRPLAFLADEMLAQLDDSGRRAVLTALSAGLPRDAVALLAEQDQVVPPPGFVDRVYRIEPDTAQIPVSPAAPEQPPAPLEPCAVRLEGLTVSRPGAAPLLRELDTHWPAGSRVVIRGPNGSGKSTLLWCLAGVLTGDAGTVEIPPHGSPEEAVRAGAVGLLLQNPELHLFARTVARQLQRRKPHHLPADRLMEIAGLQGLPEAAPDTLSHGQQHRLALASVLAGRPGVALLDEPLAGVDTASSRRILDVLDGYADAGGIVIATTHGLIPESWGDRLYSIHGGRLVEVGRGQG